MRLSQKTVLFGKQFVSLNHILNVSIAVLRTLCRLLQRLDLIRLLIVVYFLCAVLLIDLRAVK
jgi:hypothetical protein